MKNQFSLKHIFGFKRKNRPDKVNRTSSLPNDQILKEKLLSGGAGDFFESMPEGILLVDTKLRVIAVNKKIEKWLGYSKDSVVGKKITEFDFLDNESRKVIDNSHKKRLQGSAIEPYEITIKTARGDDFSGLVGASVITDDDKKPLGEIVTLSNLGEQKAIQYEQEQYVSDLKILSETAIGLAEFPNTDEIYTYISEQLQKLIGDTIVFINIFDSEKRVFRLKNIAGIKDRFKTGVKILGQNPYETEYPASEKSIRNLFQKNLFPITKGVFEIGAGKIPRPVARTIEKVFKITSVYGIGFTWQDKLFGNAIVLLRNNNKLREDIIETFIHQTSVALRRSQAEQALEKARDELEDRVKVRTADLQQTTQDLEKFKLAVDNASDHIIISDENGVIIYINQPAAMAAGYSRQELIGKTPFSWVHQMHNKYYQKIWHKIKVEKKPFVGEITRRRANNEVYIAEVHIAPVVSNGKILFFVQIERDVTRAKEIDQAKSEFVSLTSHQLRTPLTTINWYAGLILGESIGKINEKQRKYLSEIKEANQRMIKLVSALLNVSRIELGTFIVEPEKIDLQKVSQSVLAEVKKSIDDKKLKIIENYKPEIGKVNADPNLIRIVFQNLLTNAIKYTPEKGTITISVDRVKAKDSDQEGYLIKCADTGYGIPKDQQSKIFTKLFRADNVRDKSIEGTGLGLYIIKSILEHSKGKIWFESEMNKGTTFYVFLPREGMVKKAGTKKLD